MKKSSILRIAILSAVPLLAMCILFADRGEGIERKGSFDNVVPFQNAYEFKIAEELKEEVGLYRKNWTRLTGYEFSGLHWNQFIAIFVNKDPEIYTYNYSQYVKHYLEDDWDDNDDFSNEEIEPEFIEYKEGTIFLKEHFQSSNGKPASGTVITLMKKMKQGYDPEYGNWKYYWIDGVSGNIIQEGKSDNYTLYKSCIECHENMKERDFVFSTYALPPSLKTLAKQLD